ncbi:antibiotic biosynthesis monooxygenase family protein [Gloeothece verrucosa]|uniref:Antibiotic biosynthesis monooxygenase n=1 Tax=Gloeothece verrucosa (strain PCC 7822) TaxID=497965 RepID=E0UGP6_GLOV7|nr:antibiotic biosynthesis monooxygenase [Gloeothece verrucosa]ADN13255.1 Antibiotic biosynthesis monooxygenase [Gloeothece verrucosa PCC 7822]
MPTIAIHNEVITVIIIFSVEPQQQQELIDVIAEFLATVKQQPGFVSASIHKSLDGVKVANYAQWKTREDYQAFLNNTEVQAKAAKLREFNPPDIHIYEVVLSQSKIGTPTISKGGYIAHFAQFKLTPDNQPRMLELAAENIGKAMQLPGLVSANFHRSLDGTRVINYGQWLNADAIEELKKQPGFASDAPYWEGIADNEHHLYEVVLTEPVD